MLPARTFALGLLSILLSGPLSQQASASGNWLHLGSSAPDSVGLLILLSDGTVMAANNPASPINLTGKDWYRLTPDPNGHYVNGEWTRISSMEARRIFYSSLVLTNGEVLVAGGEYPVDGAQANAELYDPLADTWTPVDPPPSLLTNGLPTPGSGPAQGQGFYDCENKMLPDGTALIAPAAPSVVNGTLIFNPNGDTWSSGAPSLNQQVQSTWLKLPDDSVLTVDTGGTTSERYIPELNRWIADANLPVSLWADLGLEYPPVMGPAFMLPNGKAFFLGGSGHTAIYSPSGNTNAGTWMAGPDIPAGLVSARAPGAMMPNGKILCSVSQPPSADGNNPPQYPSPTDFFEYDYANGVLGTFSQVSGPLGGEDQISSYQSSMLVLPDGSVLYCHFEQYNLFYSSFGSQLHIYAPDGAQLSEDAPFIQSITPNMDGSFHLVGSGLNGISEGAAFGADAQMSCNYPIVRFEDTNNGHIDYARTFNWTHTGVSSRTSSTEFTLPHGLLPQTYFVSVSAAGITSAPVVFAFVNPSSLALCPGENGSLNAIPSPQPATYQWFLNGTPVDGQTTPVLNIVGATTNQTGLYSLRITSGGGSVLSPPVPVSVGVWELTQPPATNTALLCHPKTLTATARGKGSLSAQWFRNGVVIVPDDRVTQSSSSQDSVTTFVLSFAQALYQDDATYNLVITDDCGPVSEGSFAMRVTPNPPWLLVATNGPPSRSHAAAAYDSDRGVMVLFGGQTNTSSIGTDLLNDTWEFDGTNWSQRISPASPKARSYAQMVYDTKHHCLALFGGETYSNGQYYTSQDTWEWDGRTWQQIVTANAPNWTTPDQFAACYDSARGEMLIFGGYNQARVSEFWGFDGTNWAQKITPGQPPVTETIAAMDFDSTRNVAVLFGALSQLNPPFQGVWEWDGTAWQERPQSGQYFGNYQAQDMIAFDSFRGESVLYGDVSGTVDGVDSSSPIYTNLDGYRLIWRWNGEQWQADPPTPTVGISQGQYYGNMVFDSRRKALELFGGLGGGSSTVTNYTHEIIYQDDPAVLKQATIQVSLLGQSLRLSVVAEGAPPISYHWQKDGASLIDNGHFTGSISDTLTLDAAAPGDAGNYQVELSNVCGLAVSQPIQLILPATPQSVAIVFSSRSQTNLVIAWTDPNLLLQSAEKLYGPWTTISGAASPYTVTPMLDALFFRLVHH